MVSNQTVVFWLGYQQEFDAFGNYVDPQRECERRLAIDALITVYNARFFAQLGCDVQLFVHYN